MKKQLIVALGLAVIATPVLASKARLEALGEDNFGSYYINDNRNIFLNPAKINENKDLVTYEFGSSSNNTSTGTDAISAPKAEGGVIKSMGNMVYGLHFGNSTPSAAVTRTLGGTGVAEVQPWDLFVGGDAGVKWGANLTYENFDGTQGANRITSNALRSRLGVVAGDLEVFGHVSLKGDAKNRTTAKEVEGKASYFLGAGYMFNGYKFFADYKDIKADYGVQGTTASSWKFNEIRIGAARSEKLNDKATIFAKATIQRTTIEDDGVSAGTSTGQNGFSSLNGKITQTVLPLNVGLEYDAVSWLTFRTSVGQNLMGSRESKPSGASKSKTSVANTIVRAGASLKFGEFTVDGLVSNDTAGDGVADSSQANTTGGSLRTDNLMTRVSMTYRF